MRDRPPRFRFQIWHGMVLTAAAAVLLALALPTIRARGWGPALGRTVLFLVAAGVGVRVIVGATRGDW